MIIGIFNNKGGVGKTTYLYHVAHEVASRGKRVLLVDADPQCNLTAYCLRDNAVEEAWAPGVGPKKLRISITLPSLPFGAGILIVKSSLSRALDSAPRPQKSPAAPAADPGPPVGYHQSTILGENSATSVIRKRSTCKL